MANDSRRGTASGSPMAEEYLAVATERLRGRLPDGALGVDLYQADETVCLRVRCDRAKLGVDGVERRLPRSFVWAAPERQIELLREAADNLARDVEATAKAAEVGRADAAKAQAWLGPSAMAKVTEAQAEVDRRAKAMGPWTAERLAEVLNGARSWREALEKHGVGDDAYRALTEAYYNADGSGLRVHEGCTKAELDAMVAALNAAAVVDRPSVDEPLPWVPSVAQHLTGEQRKAWEDWVVAHVAAIAVGRESPPTPSEVGAPVAKADPYVAARIRRLNAASDAFFVSLGEDDEPRTIADATKRAAEALEEGRRVVATATADVARLEAAIAECGDREAT